MKDYLHALRNSNRHSNVKCEGYGSKGMLKRAVVTERCKGRERNTGEMRDRDESGMGAEGLRYKIKHFPLNFNEIFKAIKKEFTEISCSFLCEAGKIDSGKLT